MVSEPMPSDRTPGGQKSRRGWINLLLFVSLVANVFLIAMCGGRLLHRMDWFGNQPAYVQQIGPMAGRALQHMLSPLSTADRQIVLDTVQSRADELQRINQSIREQRKLVAQLLKADPFDRKAVDDAFAELRRRTDQLQSTLQAALSDAVAKLSPAARKQLED